jgi:hypothetical protein
MNERISIAGAVTSKSLLVTLRFDSSKDFALVGDRVLIMPGGGPGLLGGQERGQKGDTLGDVVYNAHSYSLCHRYVVPSRRAFDLDSFLTPMLVPTAIILNHLDFMRCL